MSSNDSRFKMPAQNPIDSTPNRQPLKKRFGCLGLAGFGGLLSCCLFWIVVAVLFGPTHSTTPKEIDETLRKIMPLQVPPGFEPKWAWKADNSLWLLNIVRYEEKNGRGLLLLGELHIRPGKMPDEQLSLRQLMEDASPDLKLVSATTSEKKTIDLRRGRGEFEIIDGTDRASTTKMRQLSGTFPGEEGIAILILQGETDHLSRESIDDVLASLLSDQQGQQAMPADASQPANGQRNEATP